MAKLIIDIPDNATNGDVIKALYPITTVKESKDLIITDADIATCFSKKWWNAPYKAEREDI